MLSQAILERNLLQMHLHTLRQHRRVVAAFQQAHDLPSAVRVRHVENVSRQVGEVFAFEAERAHRVGDMGVEAGADQHELGPALLGSVGELGGEAGLEVMPADAERQRDVERRTETLPCSGFLRVTRARIERVAMRRKERDLAVVVKRVLRPVAVVHVPIDDQHPIESVSGASMSRRDGDVVEQAEAHWGTWQGVMPRRTGQHDGSRVLSVQHCIDGGARRAGSDAGDLGRCRAEDRIDFDPAAPRCSEAVDLVDVPGRVDPAEFFVARPPRRPGGETVPQLAVGEHRVKDPQASRRLGMMSRHVVMEACVGEQKWHTQQDPSS